MSLIMAVICILIVLGLYIMSGGWKTHGGLRGVWKWLKNGGLSGSAELEKRAFAEIPNSTSEVIDVLEDIYREFTAETSKLRHDFKQALKAERDSLESEIELLRADITKLQAELTNVQLERSKQTETSDMTPLYFQILDKIQSGTPGKEIAKSLGITVNEVELVRKIMSNSVKAH